MSNVKLSVIDAALISFYPWFDLDIPMPQNLQLTDIFLQSETSKILLILKTVLIFSENLKKFWLK